MDRVSLEDSALDWFETEVFNLSLVGAIWQTDEESDLKKKMGG